jgi:hypothetical protein
MGFVGLFEVFTMTLWAGFDKTAILSANSFMQIWLEDPTLYGLKLLPLNKIVQSHTARSAEYK